MPEVSADQVGSAAVWFNSQAGITATVLAFVAVVEAVAIVAGALWCRRSFKENNASWVAAVNTLTEAWAKRIDQMRSDVKEAFAQNDALADKMVEALHSLKIEIARMSGRRYRD